MTYANCRIGLFAVVAVVALTFAAIPKPALALDGNQLLAQCTNLLSVVDQTSKSEKPGESAFQSGSCTGIALGVTHTILVYNLAAEPSKPLACLPSTGIQTGQAVRIIVKYMQEHPEDLHQDAVAIAVVALGQAFPCPHGKSTAN